MHDLFAANSLLNIGIVIIFCFKFGCIKLCDTLCLKHTEGFLFHESIGYLDSCSFLSEFKKAFSRSDSQLLDLILNFPRDFGHWSALQPCVHLVFLDHLRFEAEGGDSSRFLRVELVVFSSHCSLLGTPRRMPDIRLLLRIPSFADWLLRGGSHQLLGSARRLNVG